MSPATWLRRLTQRPRRTVRRHRPLWLERLEDRVVPTTVAVDLTTSMVSGVIDGAIFRQGLTQPAGSGNIQSFV